VLHPCGGGFEYLYRDPVSCRRRWKGKSQIWDSKIWSRVPRTSDPRKTTLSRASSIYKRQTHSLVREGAPQKLDRNYQRVINIWSWTSDRAWHRDLLIGWPSVAMWLWLWYSCCFSAPWKEVKIIALPKPGKNPKFSENLRPISACLLRGKRFEKLILKAIHRHIAERNLLNASLLTKIRPRYFTRLTKGIFHPFNVRWASGDLSLWEKCVVWVLSSFIFMFQRSHHVSVAPRPRCGFLRLHIEMFEVNAFRTFIRINFLFWRECLWANIKLTLHRAQNKSVMISACPPPPCKLATDSYILKLQRLKNRVLRAAGNFPRCTPVRNSHTAVNVPYVYNYITKLCRQQAEVMQNYENEHFRSIG
jgi:hypothetical protein